MDMTRYSILLCARVCGCVKFEVKGMRLALRLHVLYAAAGFDPPNVRFATALFQAAAFIC